MLGSPAQTVWAEIWDDIGPRIQRVMATGEATWDEALRLFLERSGYPEETYHTFSYSPVADDDGQVAGMLCVVTEETERVLGERRSSHAARPGGAVAVRAKTVDEVCHLAMDALGANPHDLPLALLYRIERRDRRADERRGHRAGSPGAPAPLARRPGRGDAAGWPLAGRGAARRRAARRGARRAVRRAARGALGEPPDERAGPARRAAGAPRPSWCWSRPSARYRPLDDSYRGFLDLVAGQIAAALGRRPRLRGGAPAGRGAGRARPGQDGVLLATSATSSGRR